jgi:hypothetical protein
MYVSLHACICTHIHAYRNVVKRPSYLHREQGQSEICCMHAYIHACMHTEMWQRDLVTFMESEDKQRMLLEATKEMKVCIDTRVCVHILMCGHVCMCEHKQKCFRKQLDRCMHACIFVYYHVYMHVCFCKHKPWILIPCKEIKEVEGMQVYVHVHICTYRASK